MCVCVCVCVCPPSPTKKSCTNVYKHNYNRGNIIITKGTFASLCRFSTCMCVCVKVQIKSYSYMCTKSFKNFFSNSIPAVCMVGGCASA